MQVITFKEFLAALLFSIVFAWVFIYLMPAVATRFMTKPPTTNSFRAEAYQKLLVRRGYIHE